MRDFFKKKKYILLVLLLLVLLGVGYFVYVYFFKDTGAEDEKTSEGNVVQDVTPRPEYDMRGSSEAMIATYASAKDWASDSKLYSCSGITLSSVEYPDVIFYFLGAQQGSYANWTCTYYSKTLGMTRIYVYDEGIVDDSTEAMEIGEYGNLMYDAITYPTDLSAVVDSTDIYQAALDNGLDPINNYANMYLSNSTEYGFVWKLHERSTTESDEYSNGLIVNSYVFDISTGELITKVQEEVY